MKTIHKDYNKLTEDELTFIDDIIFYMANEGRKSNINIPNDDRVEVVVEAIATMIVNARKKD